MTIEQLLALDDAACEMLHDLAARKLTVAEQRAADRVYACSVLSGSNFTKAKWNAYLAGI